MRFFLAALSLVSGAAAAQSSPAEAVAAARVWRAGHAHQIVAEFADLLRVPNVAADPAGLKANAERIAALYRLRGFDMRVIEMKGAAPLVIGERKSEGATRTLAIYAHYDGQPVTPADWTSPPFEPTLFTRAKTDGGVAAPFPRAGEPIDGEARLYARSAGDDKASIIALAAAIDALDGAGIAPTSNIRLIFDGEEEAGSMHLPQYLQGAKEFFSDVDLWLFCDGPTHQSGAAQLVFGVRGPAGMEVTVYGPNRRLHSGHYGNWAPGPGWRLARLLATMKDDDGRVLVKDFYKSAAPVTKADRAAIAAMPPIDDQLRETFGLAETEMHDAPLAERLLLPALNLHGLKSAEVGPGAANVIPETATASLGLRLALGDDPEKMLDLLEAHIARQGYHIMRGAPDAAARAAYPLIATVTREAGYPAVRSRIDDPAFAPLIEAVRAAAGDGLVLAPTLGGSLPLYMFKEASNAPVIVLPIANYDNNQHAADENIRLGNLFYGVDALAAALTMK
ncbi:MAG: M20/M25/M40 family metallo-hydrolase [Pseudomonadota bacterium]